MNRMYRLVVSDLDGTLLRPDHRLGDYTRSVLGRLRARGVDFMLASGRHYQDIRSLSSQLGDQGCLISCNGAQVNDQHGEVVHRRAIDPECLEFLLRDPVFERVQTNVFLGDAWLVERPEPALLEYHKDSGFSYRVADFREIGLASVLKVFYFGDHGRLRDLEVEIRSRFGDRLTCTFSLPVTLEIMARGVSKGAALARVLERRGAEPAEVIAFGDGLNDLEMLRYVGTGVVMGNAAEGLKKALPDNPVIGRSADEAVARHLDELFFSFKGTL
jgi:Cof subfamily protein (haloacid dehalogenase superfamily)